MQTLHQKHNTCIKDTNLIKFHVDITSMCHLMILNSLNKDPVTKN